MPPFMFNIGNRSFRVEVDIIRSMIDGKMRAIISGRGGVYCFQCDCTPESYIGESNRYPHVSVIYNVYCTINDNFTLRPSDNIYYLKSFLSVIYC